MAEDAEKEEAAVAGDGQPPALSKSARKKQHKQERLAAEKERQRADVERRRHEWEEALAAAPSEEARIEMVAARRERVGQRAERGARAKRLRRAAEGAEQKVVLDLEFGDLMRPNEIHSLPTLPCHAGSGRHIRPRRSPASPLSGRHQRPDAAHPPIPARRRPRWQTHPTQTCFLSSIDLHNHYSYQANWTFPSRCVVAFISWIFRNGAQPCKLGCYFSLSGFLMGMKYTNAKQMLKSAIHRTCIWQHTPSLQSMLVLSGVVQTMVCSAGTISSLVHRALTIIEQEVHCLVDILWVMLVHCQCCPMELELEQVM